MSGDQGYPPPGGWGPPPGPFPGSSPFGRPAGGGPFGWGPPPGPPQPPPAPRPGIVPLRPLGVGEILDGALQAIRRNPKAMIGLPAIVAGVFLVVLAGVQLIPVVGVRRLDTLGNSGSTGLRGRLDVAGFIGAAVGFGVTLLVLGVLAALAVTATQSCLVWLVAQATLGHRHTAGEAWRAVRDRLPRLIGIAVVQYLALLGVLVVIGGATGGIVTAAALGLHGAARVLVIVLVALLGLVALVVADVALYVRWVLAPAVLILGEQFPVPTGRPRPGVLGALRGSWQLVRGSGWRVLGITVLITLIAQVVAGIVSVPVSVVAAVVGAAGGATGHSLAATFGSGLVSALGSVIGIMLALPFTVAGVTLVYLDQRMRREGLDIAIGLGAPRW